jgi:hypothetical protein
MTLAELESLARAATPGTWAHHSSESVRICDDAHDSVAGCRTIVEAEVIGYEREQSVANAAYIAALSPERVLAMIAVIEAAKAMRHYFPHIPTQDFRHGDITAAFDAALAALDKEQK